MYTRKRGKIIIGAFVLLFVLLLGLLAGVLSPANANFSASANKALNRSSYELLSADVGGRVYDEGNNELKYNPYDGIVFSSSGIVYDNSSQPVLYDSSTKEFTNVNNDKLELIQNSLNPNNFYLVNGEYKVRTVGISDKLFGVTVKAYTDYNTGESYRMLVTVTYKKPAWIWQEGTYEYYDMYGQKISTKYLHAPSKGSSVLGDFWGGFFGGAASVAADVFWDISNYYGTVADLLVDVQLYDDYLDGDFATNPMTGDRLKDDRGFNIRLLGNQLVDSMRYPLLGSDGYPLYYNPTSYYYHTYDGALLSFDNNILSESNGFVAHSIIDELERGIRVYFILLADEVTYIPVTGKVVNTDPLELEYYNLITGDKLDSSEYISPIVSVEDRKENFPEEFEDDLNAFLATIKKFFNGIKSAFSFVSKYWKYFMWALIAILVIIGLSVFVGIVKVFIFIGKVLTFPIRLVFGRK